MDRRSLIILITGCLAGLASASGLFAQMTRSEPETKGIPSIVAARKQMDRVERLARSGGNVQSLIPKAVEALRALDDANVGAEEMREVGRRLDFISPELATNEKVNVTYLIVTSHAVTREACPFPIPACRESLLRSRELLRGNGSLLLLDQAVAALARLNDSPAWRKEILESCQESSPEAQKRTLSAVRRVLEWNQGPKGVRYVRAVRTALGKSG